MKFSQQCTFILFFAFLFTSQIAAQVVTFEPSFATQNDTLTLTFDATEGNGELAGFGGEVYLHTGVITNNSTGPTDWKYVQSGWESYPEKLKVTSLGDDKWEFNYPSSIREFYNIPSGEDALEVTLLFRGTNDGSGVPDKVGRASGGGDIFLELFDNKVSAQFLNTSQSAEILKPGTTKEIIGIGSSPVGNLNLSLKLNGTEVAQTSISDTISYMFSSEEEGNFRFDLLADNGEGESDSLSYKVIVSDGAEKQSRPNGLQDGISYSETGTSVTLSLFAPGKKDIFVIGDFNDWSADFNYLMKKDSLNADSVWYWLEIDGLTPGKEYGFQYLIDGELRITDPYSSLVLDPFNDGFISSSTFPNLLAYPEGKTSGLVTVLEPGKSDYNWEATDYQRPEKTELVIYELLIRDFLDTKNFQTLTDTLDYFEKLGVNAIELMPVNEFDGNLSWGYNPSHHLALDKFYGSPDAFKKFVDEAHKRDIAVIIDVVMNHATGDNPLYRLYSENNPYFNATPRHNFNVFNDFNHQYAGTQYYTKRMIEHWIEEYNIDGFRWDLTKGFTQNCPNDNTGCTSNYQQDRVDVLRKYADYQWAADEDFIIIFEHLGSEQEERQWTNYRISEGKGIMTWGNMNFAYSEASMGYHDNGKSNLYGVLSESRSSFQRRHLVGYMESHDEQWLMLKNRKFGNSFGDYDITELGTALGRQKMAGAFFFPLPGPKMMWQFGELGYGGGEDECLKPGGSGEAGDCLESDPNRVGEKPVRWEYYEDNERLKVYKTWSALINLRRSSPVFTNPDATNYKLAGVTKWYALEHEDSDALVVGNFGVTETTTMVTYPSEGTWFDFFTGSSETISGTQQEITLAPGEFKVYTTKEFETPEDDLLTSKEEESLSDVPSSFNLGRNYPNPFNPTTTFSYDLAETSVVKLEVFDMLGRRVAELENGRKSAGSYSVRFDAGNLSSGIYIYRLQAAGKVFTQKMTLIK